MEKVPPHCKWFPKYLTNDKTSQNKYLKAWTILEFIFFVTWTHLQAMDLNVNNGNNFLKEAEATQMSQLLEYNAFIDKGINYTPTSGYKKILCHMHKGFIISSGHMNDTNTESVYSGVFLCSLMQNNQFSWGSLTGSVLCSYVVYFSVLTPDTAYTIRHTNWFSFPNGYS
jgi:hypothetical protein